jgi:hypothetical protein
MRFHPFGLCVRVVLVNNKFHIFSFSKVRKRIVSLQCKVTRAVSVRSLGFPYSGNKSTAHLLGQLCLRSLTRKNARSTPNQMRNVLGSKESAGMEMPNEKKARLVMLVELERIECKHGNWRASGPTRR